jgi:hypothetical protein
MVTKQWLHQYMKVVSGPARVRTITHHFRFTGLEAWKIPLIIDVLPFIMHIALAAFFAGLVLFLQPMNVEVRVLAGSIAAVTYILYFIATFIPLFNFQCPYQTPLTGYAYRVYTLMRQWLYRLLRPRSKYTRPRTLAAAERDVVEKQSASLQFSAVSWLRDSSNITAKDIAIESLSGLSLVISPRSLPTDPWLVDLLKSVPVSIAQNNALRQERLIRAQSLFFGFDFPLPGQTAVAGQLEVLHYVRACRANSLDLVPRFGTGAKGQTHEVAEALLLFLDGPCSHLRHHPSVWFELLHSLQLPPRVEKYD